MAHTHREPDSPRWLNGYRSLALTLLNTAVLLLAVNVVLGVIFMAADWYAKRGQPKATLQVICPAEELFCADGAPAKTDLRTPYQLKWIDFKAYGERADKQLVSRMLDDFTKLASRGFIYQPWVQFSEPEFHGELVNVDTDAFGHPVRRTPDIVGPSDQTIDVYVFGGSTTFGYNVADTETWPYFLGRELNERAAENDSGISVKIHNYGRGYYEPSQEVALLLHLIRRGAKPAIVIFMDGVNWGTPMDQPYLTSQFVQRFEAAQFGERATILDLVDGWPMMRLARGLSRHLTSKEDAKTERARGSFDEDGIEVAERFIKNHEISSAVTAAFDIPSLFFLQPDANYNYNPELYRPSLPDSVDELRPRKAQFYEYLRSTGKYVDLTSLFQSWGNNRKAIVDDVHYSPAFNEYLAKHVADSIDIDALSGRDKGASR
jgi:hypothetical protein